MAATRPKTKPRSRAAAPFDPDKLARQEAGAYRTADGRFVVRSDRPGAWYVTDGHRVDGFGLALTLGPVATRAATAPLITAQRAEARGTEAGAVPEVTAVSGRPKPGRSKKASNASSKPAAEPVEPAVPPAAEPAAELAKEAEPATQPEPEPVRVVHVSRRRTGDERDDVADTSRAMSEAWANGSAEGIEPHLHPSIVCLPASGGRITGRKAVLASYLEPLRHGQLRAYQESHLTVDAWPDTAVVTRSFAIERDDDGVRDVERGKELLVFARIDGSWLVVWRSVTSDREP